MVSKENEPLAHAPCLCRPELLKPDPFVVVLLDAYI